MEKAAATMAGLVLCWSATGVEALPALPRTLPGLVTWSTEGPLDSERVEEVVIRVPPRATTMRVLLHVPCVVRASLRTLAGVSLSSAIAASGFDHVRDEDNGLELLSLEEPPPGTYVLEIAASECDAGQQYAAVVEVETADRIHFDVSEHAVRPGDELVLRGSVESSGKLLRAGTWRGTIIEPDGTRSDVHLADDGTHPDVAAGDGIFGALLVAGGPVGFHEVRAEVTLSPVQEDVVLTAVTGFEVSTFEDLAVVPGSVRWSQDDTAEQATIRLSAQVENLGTSSVHGVEIEFTNDLPGGQLATATIDIDPGETCTVAVPWEPSRSPVRVTVSPFHLREEADYKNNTARFEDQAGTTIDDPTDAAGAPHPCHLAPPHP